MAFATMKEALAVSLCPFSFPNSRPPVVGLSALDFPLHVLVAYLQLSLSFSFHYLVVC